MTPHTAGLVRESNSVWPLRPDLRDPPSGHEALVWRDSSNPGGRAVTNVGLLTQWATQTPRQASNGCTMCFSGSGCICYCCVSMHTCIYVCMYVCEYTHIYTYIRSKKYFDQQGKAFTGFLTCFWPLSVFRLNRAWHLLVEPCLHCRQPVLRFHYVLWPCRPLQSANMLSNEDQHEINQLMFLYVNCGGNFWACLFIQTAHPITERHLTYITFVQSPFTLVNRNWNIWKITPCIHLFCTK